jgi:uncharacterized protein (TIGR02444 family)
LRPFDIPSPANIAPGETSATLRKSDSAFWRFSLRFYARDGVAPLCLSLQDQHGIDVNLLFLLLFLAYQQRRVTPAEAQEIDHAAAAWRIRAVQPLRALRRDLKNGVAGMDATATEALRNEIKRCELHAERLQQEMLERSFPAASTGVTSTVKEAAPANIAAYGAVLGSVNGALPADAVEKLLRLFAEEFGE